MKNVLFVLAAYVIAGGVYKTFVNTDAPELAWIAWPAYALGWKG